MGIIENNVYIVGGGESCFVVDPSCDPQRILDAVGDRMVEAIVITHCHWDHTGAAAALREATGAPVVASAIDAPFITCELPMPDHTVRNTPCPVDRMVADGDVLRLASRDWRVIATPGHTAGGVCYFLPASHAHPGMPVLLSGDTLFQGTHGRTDFPESDPAAMRESLKRLAELPDDTAVLPGHNGFTTIARERVWLQRGGIVR
ncbi:MAG TPA: MBL fold metallo-hydrolase [Eggerthellaceae bacterium]|nr:MBL fold metallo-hydrolase [Eggerthellaceae bacterium]